MISLLVTEELSSRCENEERILPRRAKFIKLELQNNDKGAAFIRLSYVHDTSIKKYTI